MECGARGVPLATHGGRAGLNLSYHIEIKGGRIVDDAKRDDYFIEILDRLARVEEKLDNNLETKRTADDALDLAQENRTKLKEVNRRLAENDKKWDNDRKEKLTIWLTVAGFFVTTAISVLTILFK